MIIHRSGTFFIRYFIAISCILLLTATGCLESSEPENNDTEIRPRSAVPDEPSEIPEELYLHYMDLDGDELVWHPITSDEPAPPSITIDGDEIVFNLPGFYLGVKDTGEREYSRIIIPGHAPLYNEGMPELPLIRTNIAIPENSDSRIRPVSHNHLDLTVLPPLPSRGHISRSVDPRSVPYEPRSFYFGGRGELYPEETIRADSSFILRDLHGLPVEILPFAYYPEKGIVRVYTNMRARIIHSDTSRSLSETSISPEFQGIYRRVFDNFDRVARYNPIAEPGRMAIISADVFVDDVEPLAAWKNQRGLQTELIPLSSIGERAADIQSWIRDQYFSPEGLVYVILVGDSDTMPTLKGTYERADSDSSFAMVDGDDLYPDLFVSRISARTSDHVAIQVNKFIEYERNPDPAASWYQRAIGIASNEGFPADYVLADRLRTSLMEDYGYTHVAQIYDPGARASHVSDEINMGASIINYLGHGTGPKWETSNFSTFDAFALTNTDGSWPFVIDVACLNGNWVGLETSLAEAMLRAGTPEAPTGAIAMYSASTLASWVPPTVMQNHIIKDLIVEEQSFSAGGLFYGGAMQVIDQYGAREGAKLVEQYNIFGDASLLVRTQYPKILTVNHPSSANPAGQMNISVSSESELKFATAALYQEGPEGLRGSAMVGPDGFASIEYSGLTSGDLILTVTGHNAIPYIVELPVDWSGNMPPVADAGDDQVADELAFVQLDGTGSYDPDGDEITALWTQISGPEVELMDADTFTPGFYVPELDELTVFVFSLVVHDGEYFSAPDRVSITVYGEIDWAVELESEDTPIDIPDNTPEGIESIISVDRFGLVERGEISVDITHTYIGDLRVTLVCPSGTSQVLHNRTGGSLDDINETWDITDCIGEQAFGDWKLIVSDNARIDIGHLDNWSIKLKIEDPGIITTLLDESLTEGDAPEGWNYTDIDWRTAAGGYALLFSEFSSLETPVLDLSGYQHVHLQFDVAKYDRGEDGPLTVEISNDGGISWEAGFFKSEVPENSSYISFGPAEINVSSETVIRFSRVDSPSQKRLRNVVLAGFTSE